MEGQGSSGRAVRLVRHKEGQFSGRADLRTTPMVLFNRSIVSNIRFRVIGFGGPWGVRL